MLNLISKSILIQKGKKKFGCLSQSYFPTEMKCSHLVYVHFRKYFFKNGTYDNFYIAEKFQTICLIKILPNDKWIYLS